MSTARHHERGATRRARVLLSCLMLALVPAGSFAKGLPLRTQKGDIPVWDEEYLRGSPKGWTAPEDYHAVFGRDLVPPEIRKGRFGLMSGQRLYTSWRPIVPLTDEQYAQGKVKLLGNHTSEVVTPEFEIKNDYITFLISGAKLPGKACVNLLIDDKVVRSATGDGHDILMPAAFDVREFKGQKARFQALDTSVRAFDYITVDCVYQSVNPKGATLVIAEAPAETKEAGRMKTASGTTNGKVDIVGGALTIAGQAVDLGKIIELQTGVTAAAPDAGSRVLLTNGDLLAGDITGLTEAQLILSRPTREPLELNLAHVAQAIFLPGPTVPAKPGTLVQINNRLIPGTLKWIREENIAVDCSLGLVPLPRTRVRSFVFAEVTAESAASSQVTLADGSVLNGSLAVNDEGLVLTHALLGDLMLDLGTVASITRPLSKAQPLAELQGEVVKQTGPITPPAPETIRRAAGLALRMFPGTVTRYALPPSDQARRLRGELVPLPGTKTELKVTVRMNGKVTSFSVPPGAQTQVVDLDLGTTDTLEIEVQADASQAFMFPSGIEWHQTLITEGGAS